MLQLYRIDMLPHQFCHEWKRHEKLNTQMMYERNASTPSNPFLFRLKNTSLRCADVRMKICFTRDFFFVFFCCCCLFNYYSVFSFIQHKYLLYQRNVSGPICYVFNFSLLHLLGLLPQPSTHISRKCYLVISCS